MSNFLEDPRLRQRWNQISHNAEGVAENAAAGIWTFQHRYIGPCLASICDSLDSCTAVCLGGDREERARRMRERERGARRTRAEYSFDFYDDWDDDDDALAGYGYGSYAGIGAGQGSGAAGDAGRGSGPGFFGRWFGGDGGGGGGANAGAGSASGGGRSRAEDWDRLLAGTGASRTARNKQGSGPGSAGDVQTDQPRRNRTMSYGTRGAARRKASGQEDPTIIPSTSSFGFLGRLPFKVGGTLRYKPSAANLQDHPGATRPMPGQANKQHEGGSGEREPLLGPDDDDDDFFGDADSEGEGDGEVIFSQDQLKMQPQPYRHLPHQPQRQHSPHNIEDEQTSIYNPKTRKRSSTTGSGATSDSYRSRGDLFPSDGEGEEDAVPLDDEFAVALDRVVIDDRSSSAGKGRRGSKGKRPTRLDSTATSGKTMSRSVSQTTMKSTMSSSHHSHAAGAPSPLPPTQSRSASSLRKQGSSASFDVAAVASPRPPSIMEEDQLHMEDELVGREEDEEIERRRHAAALLAAERGLHREEGLVTPTVLTGQTKHEGPVSFDDIPEPLSPAAEGGADIAVDTGETRAGGDSAPARRPPPPPSVDAEAVSPDAGATKPASVQEEFFPAKLPFFR